MKRAEVEATAQALVANGKGILAADESTGTITKRFDAIDVQSTPDSRRAYREMLLSTPGLGKYISGVIMYDETIRQSAADGTPMVELQKRQHVIPGIKVDKGTTPLAACPGKR
jgi:fructose-bisphosphate aldolase class I